MIIAQLSVNRNHFGAHRGHDSPHFPYAASPFDNEGVANRAPPPDTGPPPPGDPVDARNPGQPPAGANEKPMP